MLFLKNHANLAEGYDKSYFLLDYSYRAYLPGVKKKAVDMAINGCGIRNSARVLNISRITILSTLKKRKKSLSSQS